MRVTFDRNINFRKITHRIRTGRNLVCEAKINTASLLDVSDSLLGSTVHVNLRNSIFRGDTVSAALLLRDIAPVTASCSLL